MSATVMSSLFRPWAAEKQNSHKLVDGEETFMKNYPVFDKLFPVQPLSELLKVQQDSTVSTTTFSTIKVQEKVHSETVSSVSASTLKHSSEPESKNVDIKPSSEMRQFRKCSKSCESFENKSRKRKSLKSHVTKSEPPFRTDSHNNLQHATVLNTPSLPIQSWSTKSSNISSGRLSAFHPQIPSPKNMNIFLGGGEVIKTHPHLDNLPFDPSVLEQYSFGCPASDLSYMSQYCCPEVSVDLLSSELALENALRRGVMPSPAQMEEYARLLQIQEHNLKGSSRKQRPKKYRCPHCQVAFSNNGQLKGHVRIHTGERPFKCDVTSCSKTFTRNEELTRHKRIHSGLRPYACATCGKRFGRKDHLKKHVRTHQPQYHRQTLMVPLLPPMGHPFPYLYGL